MQARRQHGLAREARHLEHRLEDLDAGQRVAAGVEAAERGARPRGLDARAAESRAAPRVVRRASTSELRCARAARPSGTAASPRARTGAGCRAPAPAARSRRALSDEVDAVDADRLPALDRLARCARDRRRRCPPGRRAALARVAARRCCRVGAEVAERLVGARRVRLARPQQVRVASAEERRPCAARLAARFAILVAVEEVQRRDLVVDDAADRVAAAGCAGGTRACAAPARRSSPPRRRGSRCRARRRRARCPGS